jgi:hypothetical protein
MLMKKMGKIYAILWMSRLAFSLAFPTLTSQSEQRPQL